MAPEMFDKTQPTDWRVDVYAFGVLLLEVNTNISHNKALTFGHVTHHGTLNRYLVARVPGLRNHLSK
jgi:hypothetical protein